MARERDYSNWSKEDLIKRVEALEKRKKYGLVWDEEYCKEEFEEEAKGKLPVLTEIKTKEINTDPNEPTDILIEGDNYHALSVLNYTHEKAVDVIYIDPPFNTGSRSWKYNNDYVDKDDPFRHSKWISFMNKRLRLAKNLLRDTGIIIVAIDDYEFHSLRLLMDEIFLESNRLGTVAVMHNPRGRSDDKFFATSHEYMLIYGRNSSLSYVANMESTEEQLEVYNKEDDISRYRELPFRRSGSNSRRIDRPNLFYPIYYNPQSEELISEKREGFIEILPIDTSGTERVWRWGKETFSRRVQTEIVVKESNGLFNVYVKDRIKEGRKSKTIWQDPKYDASSHGTMLLQEILGRPMMFDYPKSLYTVLDILAITSDKDAIILDFFAGSGTTGHATMKLNKKDHGKRQFILCTNNENGICEDVCYPRVKSVITGYKDKNGKPVDGLGGNLKYYRTSFVPAEPTDKNKELLTKQSVEMLTLRENTFDFVTETNTYKIFNNREKYTGIIFDQLSIPEFKKAITSFDKPVSVYVFSLGDDSFAEEFEDMRDKVKVCSIPEAILRVYRRVFK